MGLFDHDARPATPAVQLVGDRLSAAAYALRDFLTRNGLPYDWQEVDGTAAPSIPPIYHSASSATAGASHARRSSRLLPALA